jgi:hypothetical protein
MKFTKSYLKKVIQEEYKKIYEQDSTTQSGSPVAQQPPEQTKQEIINKINYLDAQVKAAEATVKNLPNLKKQLQDARDQLGKL